MQSATKPPSTRHAAVVAGVAVALTGAVALLYFYEPATAGFYPICAFHAMTGLDCPGCGGLRAVHQLSHGNIAAAWHFNPLLVALLPMALWLGFREFARMFTGRRWPGIVTRPIMAWVLLGVVVAFGIVRNLPGFPKP